MTLTFKKCCTFISKTFQEYDKNNNHEKINGEITVRAILKSSLLNTVYTKFINEQLKNDDMNKK